jgi:hypothetical protein
MLLSSTSIVMHNVSQRFPPGWRPIRTRSMGSGMLVEQEFAKDPDLRDNWNIVKDWAETSRYEAGRQNGEADGLYSAITDPAHGVLTCISK